MQKPNHRSLHSRVRPSGAARAETPPLDTASGELRLIEIKGLAGETGMVALTPNEKRVAEDRRDCYWLYVVTRCKQPEGPQVMPIGDPARLAWHEVKKVEHYQLSVDALTMQPGWGTRA